MGKEGRKEGGKRKEGRRERSRKKRRIVVLESSNESHGPEFTPA